MRLSGATAKAANPVPVAISKTRSVPLAVRIRQSQPAYRLRREQDLRRNTLDCSELCLYFVMYSAIPLSDNCRLDKIAVSRYAEGCHSVFVLRQFENAGGIKGNNHFTQVPRSKG